jgi:hypothetical protein
VLGRGRARVLRLRALARPRASAAACSPILAERRYNLSPDFLKRAMPTSMLIRILVIALVSVLSGCEHVLDCQYGVVPQSRPARCMTRGEYNAAREKLRNSQDEARPKRDRQADPRYEEWIP